MKHEKLKNNESENEITPQNIIDLDLTDIKVEDFPQYNFEDNCVSQNETLNSNKFESTNTDINRKKKKRHKIIIIAIIFATIISSITTTALIKYCKEQKKLKEEYAALVQSTINQDAFYDGIIVCGINLCGKTKDEAKQILTEAEPSLRQDVCINIICGNKTVTLNKDDFSFTYNTDDILEQAYTYARDGDDEKKYKKIASLKESPIYYDITATINSHDTDTAVNKVFSESYVPAKNATISNFDISSESKFQFSEGKNGLEVDKNEIKNDLEKLLISGKITGEITTPMHDISCSITVADLNANTCLLSRFSTISTNTANANSNMKLALNAVNSTVLEPGETFSFNSKTGNSNLASLGYLPAGAIVNGKISESYGGGICQAATTIYGAAIRSNIDIVERHNHAWKSSYVPIGLDATIDYPGLDLKLKNNLSSPICIGAYMSSTTLTCEIYGPKPSDYDKIDITSNITETVPEPSPKYITDSSLESAKEVVDVQGRTGYKAEAYKIYYKSGTEIKREILPSSYYPATAKIIKKGS